MEITKNISYLEKTGAKLWNRIRKIKWEKEIYIKNMYEKTKKTKTKLNIPMTVTSPNEKMWVVFRNE